MAMSWWKRKKCPLCKSVIKAKHKTSEVRIDTAEGILELEVCPKCAYVLDKSADVLLGKDRATIRPKQKDSGSVEEAD